MFVIKLIGAVVLLAALGLAVFIGDAGWNDSRLFYAVAGREQLVRDCQPLTVEKLIGDGFTPTDLAFDPRPSLGFAAMPGSRTRVFSSGFTFSDGPLGQRVDGHVRCMVSGKSVTVDVDVDSLPHRTT